MVEKVPSQRCRERISRESKALQKNLEKRKHQIEAREKLKKQKAKEKEQENG